MSDLVEEQQAPRPSDHPPAWEAVIRKARARRERLEREDGPDPALDVLIADMEARDAEGRRKYGMPLRPFNGRDALVDAYQEALDMAVYLQVSVMENPTPNARMLAADAREFALRVRRAIHRRDGE